MEWIQVVTAAIGGGGIATAGVSFYQARKSAQIGQSGNEIEASKAASADWSAFTAEMRKSMADQDKKISSLEDKVRHLEHERALDGIHIDKLQEHIWYGLQPPPPKRPTTV